MDLDKLYCEKCGESFRRVMALAMIEAFGGKCYPPPNVCSQDGGEHLFKEKGKECQNE